MYLIHFFTEFNTFTVFITRKNDEMNKGSFCGVGMEQWISRRGPFDNKTREEFVSSNPGEGNIWKIKGAPSILLHNSLFTIFQSVFSQQNGSLQVPVKIFPGSFER